MEESYDIESIGPALNAVRVTREPMPPHQEYTDAVPWTDENATPIQCLITVSAQLMYARFGLHPDTLLIESSDMDRLCESKEALSRWVCFMLPTRKAEDSTRRIPESLTKDQVLRLIEHVTGIGRVVIYEGIPAMHVTPERINDIRVRIDTGSGYVWMIASLPGRSQ